MLPYLAHGNAAAQAALLDHYAGCLDLTALDAAGPDTPPHQVTLNAPPCISLSDLYADSIACPGSQTLDCHQFQESCHLGPLSLHLTPYFLAQASDLFTRAYTRLCLFCDFM